MNKFFSTLENGFMCLMLTAIFIVTILAILGRNTGLYTLYWNLEFVQFSLVLGTFLGSGFVQREKAHIELRFLSDRINAILHRKGKIVFLVLKKIIESSFLIVLILWSYELAKNSKLFLSSAMGISFFWIYTSISIGSIFYLLRNIEFTIDSIKQIVSGGND